jgi:hypothetical protein
MRALTIFVVVMGVVIVIGFGVVIAVVAGRLSQREPAVPAHAFAAGAVDLPQGARIEAMTASPERLILDLALPDGGRRIIVFDLSTGARLGTIDLRPTPR